MRSKDYIKAYIDIISKIDEHIKELNNLQGQVIGRDQAVMELKMLRSELASIVRKG